MGANKWLNDTEIVAGFVYRGKLDANVVNPDDFYPPYNETIPTMRDAKDLEEAKEQVISKHGYSTYRDAVAASESVNSGTTPLNWVQILEKSAKLYKSGTDLERLVAQLKDGKDIELGKLLQIAGSMDLGYRALTPLSEVEPEKGQWIKTGYAPLDDHTNGLPKAGLTLVAGSPGVGKTTFALGLGLSMLRIKANKKKKIAIFSLEMLMSQLMARYLDLDKSITKDERSRILASESAYSIGEIYALAARTAAQEKLCAIIIDFADLMVEGEQTESIMGQIYRSLSVLAKQTGIPVILICQLNRATYTGGVPKINHIRYSGMAEAMASMILLLYNPNAIIADYKADNSLPPEEGRGYIIIGKSRFGFKAGHPGAVKAEWTPETGWGSKHFGYFRVTS